ncbi:hypothetical protein GA0074694_2174 [Micromonospora inyonensis]|uniref:Uncharacterized protein n=2 Tax=Micromonospora inyonensis TaxID=47866 RepID=A0A1C6RL71_9ACTN|nr:hypothetical protein GA0074694_2174 [Micromonospora inyonensis]
MLTLTTRFLTASPPRCLNAGRWSPAELTVARAGAAVMDAGGVTSDAYAWGYAVRREWSSGAHDLFGFTPDAAIAQRRLDRDQGYWRTGPMRPAAVYLVAANAVDVNRHPVDGCRMVSCPDSPRVGEWR